MTAHHIDDLKRQGCYQLCNFNNFNTDSTVDLEPSPKACPLMYMFPWIQTSDKFIFSSFKKVKLHPISLFALIRMGSCNIMVSISGSVPSLDQYWITAPTPELKITHRAESPEGEIPMGHRILFLNLESWPNLLLRDGPSTESEIGVENWSRGGVEQFCSFSLNYGWWGSGLRMKKLVKGS